MALEGYNKNLLLYFWILKNKRILHRSTLKRIKDKIRKKEKINWKMKNIRMLW